jgi:hypothetical protein
MRSHQPTAGPESAYVDQLFIALMSALRSYQNRHGQSDQTHNEMIAALAKVVGSVAPKPETRKRFIDRYQRGLTE